MAFVETIAGENCECTKNGSDKRKRFGSQCILPLSDADLDCRLITWLVPSSSKIKVKTISVLLMKHLRTASAEYKGVLN